MGWTDVFKIDPDELYRKGITGAGAVGAAAGLAAVAVTGGRGYVPAAVAGWAIGVYGASVAVAQQRGRLFPQPEPPPEPSTDTTPAPSSSSSDPSQEHQTP